MSACATALPAFDVHIFVFLFAIHGGNVSAMVVIRTGLSCRQAVCSGGGSKSYQCYINDYIKLSYLASSTSTTTYTAGSLLLLLIMMQIKLFIILPKQRSNLCADWDSLIKTCFYIYIYILIIGLLEIREKAG